MNHQVARTIELLKLIPKAPRRITAGEIAERLKDAGFVVSKRTIERDLNTLSQHHPITADDSDKPFGWYWIKGAPLMELPEMNLNTALSFSLLSKWIKQLLPVGTLSELQGHIDYAHAVLRKREGKQFKAWEQKVFLLPSGMSLQPPSYDEELLTKIYSALFHDQQLRVMYQSREADEPEERIFNPLGLVFRNNTNYVIGTFWDYADVLQLSIHRFHDVENVLLPVRKPKGFSIKRYVDSGAFSYPVSTSQLNLQARFFDGAGDHLQESPLTSNQTIAFQGKSMLLKAKVLDSNELRWWLQGFGCAVEVLKPASLREEFKRNANALKMRYR